MDHKVTYQLIGLLTSSFTMTLPPLVAVTRSCPRRGSSSRLTGAASRMAVCVTHRPLLCSPSPSPSKPRLSSSALLLPVHPLGVLVVFARSALCPLLQAVVESQCLVLPSPFVCQRLLAAALFPIPSACTGPALQRAFAPLSSAPFLFMLHLANSFPSS